MFQQDFCVSLQIKRTCKLECILVHETAGCSAIADFSFYCRTLVPGRLLMKKTVPEIQEGKMQRLHNFRSIGVPCYISVRQFSLIRKICEDSCQYCNKNQ